MWSSGNISRPCSIQRDKRAPSGCDLGEFSRKAFCCEVIAFQGFRAVNVAMKFASLVVFAALLAPSTASEPQEQEQEQEQNEPPCVYPSSDYPDCSAIDQEQLPTNAYDPAACVAKSCGQCYFDHSSGDGRAAAARASPSAVSRHHLQALSRARPAAVVADRLSAALEGSNDKVLLLEAGGRARRRSTARTRRPSGRRSRRTTARRRGSTCRASTATSRGPTTARAARSTCRPSPTSRGSRRCSAAAAWSTARSRCARRRPTSASGPTAGSPHLAPQFTKLESDLTLTATPSTDGVQHATDPRDAFEAGFAGAGYDFTLLDSDPDARASTYSRVQVTAVDGARQSSATKYLPTAKLRASLEVKTNAAAVRLLKSGDTVIGVHYDGGVAGLATGGRVVLTAGALATPALLQLSGIGPASALKELYQSDLLDDPHKLCGADSTTSLGCDDLTEGGAAALSAFDSDDISDTHWVANDAVGAGLSDHTMTRLTFRKPGLVGFDASARAANAAQLAAYFTTKTGPYAQYAPPVWRTQSPYATNLSPPPSAPPAPPSPGADIEVFVGTDSATNDAEAFDCYVMLLRPRTSTALDVLADVDYPRGYRTFPRDYGRLYLHDADDVATMAWGVAETASALLDADPSISVQLGSTVPLAAGVPSADQVAALVASWDHSHLQGNHWAGTCAVGSCACSADARVAGTSNVHVADASLHPGQLSAHPVLTVMATAAEVAARILATDEGLTSCSDATSSATCALADACYWCDTTGATRPTRRRRACSPRARRATVSHRTRRLSSTTRRRRPSPRAARRTRRRRRAAGRRRRRRRRRLQRRRLRRGQAVRRLADVHDVRAVRRLRPVLPPQLPQPVLLPGRLRRGGLVVLPRNVLQVRAERRRRAGAGARRHHHRQALQVECDRHSRGGGGAQDPGTGRDSPVDAADVGRRAGDRPVNISTTNKLLPAVQLVNYGLSRSTLR